MAEEASSLSVVDVYDIAASIGKEFETIIDNYGAEAVTELMPKVICVLEHLEVLANKNQKENAEIAELRYTIERLTAEKTARAEEKIKYEQELEQIEESWRTEAKELLDMVGKLQEDNRRLQGALEETEGQTKKSQRGHRDSGAEEEEQRIMLKMKEAVDKQRDQVRALKRELSQKSVDLEAMQGEVKRLAKFNTELKRRAVLAKEQAHELIEAADISIQNMMQSQMERIAKLNADYRRKNRLTQQQATNLIQEKADLQAQLHDKEQQICKIKDLMREQDSTEGSPPSPLEAHDLGKVEELLSLEGKMVIDLKDPDRPRFTISELREVLQERNELKTKLIEVEEELQFYKPESESQKSYFDFDAPVHGPINKEPDEKLYPDQVPESNIRKLFRFLFKDEKNKKSPQRKPRKESPKVL